MDYRDKNFLIKNQEEEGEILDDELDDEEPKEGDDEKEATDDEEM